MFALTGNKTFLLNVSVIAKQKCMCVYVARGRFCAKSTATMLQNIQGIEFDLFQHVADINLAYNTRATALDFW